MGFWSWLTRDSSSPRDPSLTQALMALEQERIKRDAELAKLDHELRLKTRELEIQNIEALSTQKRLDQETRERLREERRENFRKAREAKAEKAAKNRAAAAPQAAAHHGLAGCRVCAAPSDPTLSAEEITWHAAGHPGAMSHIQA